MVTGVFPSAPPVHVPSFGNLGAVNIYKVFSSQMAKFSFFLFYFCAVSSYFQIPLFVSHKYCNATFEAFLIFCALLNFRVLGTFPVCPVFLGGEKKGEGKEHLGEKNVG